MTCGFEDRGDPVLAVAGYESESVAAVDVADGPKLDSYDRIIVAFSGGKDSVACVLNLLEQGVAPERIELHHHLVDGREGPQFMDWPVTHAYCTAFARALGLAISFSWREHGFAGEMLRSNSPTGAVWIPDGSPDKMRRVGGDGPEGTRRKFPQVCANLAQRWCSAALKVDVFDRWVTNDSRFLTGRTLVVTGERAQESASRANYAAFEPHRRDLRNGRLRQRHVDHWRAVHRWDESQVWAILERWRILAHPAYWLGLGRCSCMCCIFASKDQWATVRFVAPGQFNAVAEREREFGMTIQRKRSVVESADAGRVLSSDERWKKIAMSERFDEPIIMTQWELPPGAYGDSSGPT